MNFQMSRQGSPRQRPQGSFLVPGVGLGWGPGSVAVMVPGAESPGSPHMERPPCVTGSPDLGGDPMEEPGEGGAMKNI